MQNVWWTQQYYTDKLICIDSRHFSIKTQLGLYGGIAGIGGIDGQLFKY